ncbi:TRAP transporter small permease subunit [Nitratireductor sp. ZSWI3]|uniref:TRAP transporter small permease subunit n=1 Tax=Nitratireductor sp. ZSWI3 TaxID=2966359 RepID=UPI00214F88E8|nr:TRAP transporter small permease [Nitratireductor sp. ZSWI3]MCR4268904.1 TRAP transporter small permease [Nitratireductor sp. ZSWI3]
MSLESKSARGEMDGVSSLPGRLAAALTRLGGALSAVTILAVLVTTAVSVFNRYVLGRPIMGADEATGFLVVVIVMLGAAEALRRGDHIRIDLLFDRFGPRGRWWLDLWSSLTVLVFAALFCITSWHTVIFSRRFGAYSTGYLSLPMWIPQSVMVVGAVLLGIAAIAQALRLVAERPR